MRYLLFLLSWSLLSGTATAQSKWQHHESPTQADLHNIYFASDSLGWVISHEAGLVLHTTDSGESWSVQARLDSVTFEDIYFLNKDTGWISAEKGLLFKTTDGGKHWRKQKIADKKSWVYSVRFFDKNHGLAVGLREERPITLFLSTFDGGKNWKNIQNKVPPSYYAPVALVDDRKGYVGGFKIIYTDNRGQSWQKQNIDTTSSSKCPEIVRGLAMVNSKMGWAVGRCGLILSTTDGKTWHHQKKFTTNRLRGVRFINQSEGYIVGDSNKEPGVLYHTEDGGKTWKTVMKKLPNLHRITLTENKIWLVGNEGTILSKFR